MPESRTVNGVPLDLIAYEIERQLEKAEADARGPESCHYRADLLGRQVAKHSWLTRHAANSPERRAARKLLRETTDAVQSAMDADGLTAAVILAETIVEQAAA
jgi:hypothetical protein